MKALIARCGSVALLTVLPVLSYPSAILAEDLAFGVSPTEVTIENLVPGQTAEFEVALRNKDNLPLTLAVTTFRPPADRRREGRAEFPDPGWISISPWETELPAGSESTLIVAIAIPAEHQWAGHDWEIWLAATTESDDLLAVELYVRLLISTAPAGQAGSGVRLAAAALGALTILACGVYYHRLRRRARLP